MLWEELFAASRRNPYHDEDHDDFVEYTFVEQ